jgi:hypothetical protein
MWGCLLRCFTKLDDLFYWVRAASGILLNTRRVELVHGEGESAIFGDWTEDEGLVVLWVEVFL